MINIYTLAEKDVLIAHLKNAIRWSPWPTYGYFSEFRPSGRNVNREIVEQSHAEGVVIHVERIFELICKSGFPQYNRHFFDDALWILRLMLKEFPGMLKLADSPEMREDLKTLRNFSPPLYDKAVELIENL